MTKFKIGDKVKCIDPTMYSNFKGGEEGVIKEDIQYGWFRVIGINGFHFHKGIQYNDDR